MLKYLTPYLLEAEKYFDLNMRKVVPVYCNRIDGNQVAISIYNEDLTKEIDGYAWLYESDLAPYHQFTQRMLQNELDDLWSQWDEDEEETE